MRRAFFAFVLLVSLSGAASAMSVQTFLAKAERAQNRGPLALLSSDVKLLMNQVKSDATGLRAQNEALAASNKPKAYCTPDDFRMGQKEVMEAMRSVPTERRSATSTRAALRDYLAQRFPCRS